MQYVSISGKYTHDKRRELSELRNQATPVPIPNNHAV